MSKTEAMIEALDFVTETAPAKATTARKTLNERREEAARSGLYNPAREHDACGVGFVAHLKGVPSHRIVSDGLQVLENLTHRGAVGADPLMGDGAGMLVQIPHDFFAAETKGLGFELPEKGRYGVGFLFLPQDPALRRVCEEIVERVINAEGQACLGWRDVPVDNSSLSKAPDIAATEPCSRQVFIACRDCETQDDFERRLFVLRKVISNVIRAETDAVTKGFYIVSLSSRTLVYKGMFLAYQLGAYYADLKDPRFTSALALVHQRFSTNTFPSWDLAHPYRMVAHNGEINTLRGNVNWMAARQASVSSPLFGDDISKLWPISYEGPVRHRLLRQRARVPGARRLLARPCGDDADSRGLGRQPAHDENLRAFYEYHAALMEPWDGPAAVAFTDGRQIGATLDRNGLRPARYVVTDDDFVIMSSEVGVLPVPEEKIIRKWRLQPGKMLLIDLEEGRIISDDEIKRQLSTANPYKDWLHRTQIVLEEMPAVRGRAPVAAETLLDRQQAFGYTQEDIKLLMHPMATVGQEAIGSMGTDTPISALSDKPKLLYTYFKQNFAQVTNPPIDPIREELVMSLVSFIGPRPNLFDLKGLATSAVWRFASRSSPMTTWRRSGPSATPPTTSSRPRRWTSPTTRPRAGGMREALDNLCANAEKAVVNGYNIVILSDRLVSRGRIAIPALLATAAVHHHLIRKGLRTSVGLVVETGEARGASLLRAGRLRRRGDQPLSRLRDAAAAPCRARLPREVDADEVVYRYIKSIDKGILKVMSKMGISTYQSYCGAQIFDAVGLSTDFVNEYFFGTATMIEGIGLAEVAEETARRHAVAFADVPVLRRSLDVGGEYAYRVRGESHLWTPEGIAFLQHAVRSNLPEQYREFARETNEHNGRFTIRGLFRVKTAEDVGRAPISIDEVEPAAEIVKRFSTGAMSFGSISREAHSTLAVAMNRIGGKSNTGEGGEEPERYMPLPDGSQNPMRSAIKQVASGRFGVTTDYLVNSDMIQIKVAQGAKPGEGGQLPGHKVDAVIAKVRHSTQGVGLISPPPHHDIYSIEDLRS